MPNHKDNAKKLLDQVVTDELKKEIDEGHVLKFYTTAGIRQKNDIGSNMVLKEFNGCKCSVLISYTPGCSSIENLFDEFCEDLTRLLNSF